MFYLMASALAEDLRMDMDIDEPLLLFAQPPVPEDFLAYHAANLIREVLHKTIGKYLRQVRGGGVGGKALSHKLFPSVRL